MNTFLHALKLTLSDPRISYESSVHRALEMITCHERELATTVPEPMKTPCPFTIDTPRLACVPEEQC